jgi:predicted ester cyclase
MWRAASAPSVLAIVEAKQVLKRAIAAWNRADLDSFASLAAPNLHIVAPGGISFRGADGMRNYLSLWRRACPDHTIRCHNVVAEGNVSIGEGTMDGTHQGPLHHPAGNIPPTGRRLRIDFVGALRTTDGKVDSFRIYFDVLDLMHQLGLVGRE